MALPFTPLPMGGPNLRHFNTQPDVEANPVNISPPGHSQHSWDFQRTPFGINLPESFGRGDTDPASMKSGLKDTAEYQAAHVATESPNGPVWFKAFKELKRQDEEMVKEYREEVDTLLVFAGLFSAVVTAFVIESHSSLKQDDDSITVKLLQQISDQLSASSLKPPQQAEATEPTAMDTRVNAFWHTSLVLSLLAALLGIYVKEWARTYMKWTEVTPLRDAVALRQYRREGLTKWKLSMTLTILPGLLQVAVILFLIGLVDFLLTLTPLVMGPVLAVTSLGLLVALIVTVVPLFSRSCPFKSPVSEAVVQIARLILWYMTGGLRPRMILSDKIRTSWRDRDLDAIHLDDQRSKGRGDVTARMRAIHHVCLTATDEHIIPRLLPGLHEKDENGARYLPLLTCWPIAAARLGFRDAQSLIDETDGIRIIARNTYFAGTSARDRELVFDMLLEAVQAKQNASNGRWRNAVFLLSSLAQDQVSFLPTYAKLLAQQSKRDKIAMEEYTLELYIRALAEDQMQDGWNLKGLTALLGSVIAVADAIIENPKPCPGELSLLQRLTDIVFMIALGKYFDDVMNTVDGRASVTHLLSSIDWLLDRHGAQLTGFVQHISVYANRLLLRHRRLFPDTFLQRMPQSRTMPMPEPSPVLPSPGMVARNSSNDSIRPVSIPVEATFTSAEHSRGGSEVLQSSNLGQLFMSSALAGRRRLHISITVPFAIGLPSAASEDQNGGHANSNGDE